MLFEDEDERAQRERLRDERAKYLEILQLLRMRNDVRKAGVRKNGYVENKLFNHPIDDVEARYAPQNTNVGYDVPPYAQPDYVPEYPTKYNVGYNVPIYARKPVLEDIVTGEPYIPKPKREPLDDLETILKKSLTLPPSNPGSFYHASPEYQEWEKKNSPKVFTWDKHLEEY